MIIATPRETKDHEYRVGLTPSGTRALCAAGHRVLVETAAGERVGFSDAAYRQAGAEIAPDAETLWTRAELIVKVKEPQPTEFALIHAGQILFCFQHFAPDPRLLDAMLASGASCVAFEAVSDSRGQFPLLVPMSRIAGRLAPQMGAWALTTAQGGSGVLLGGLPGTPPAKVVVIGAGTVGAEAVRIAVGLGARVLAVDREAERLAALDQIYAGRIETAVTGNHDLAEHIVDADMLVGAVLLPGRRAPKLVTRAMLGAMRPGSVLVDVAIDQGGIAETSRVSSHSAPLYVEDGVLHYCVPNMPSACARTATLALAQATLPRVLALADKGLAGALASDAGLRDGLQVHAGQITHLALAQDVGRPVVAPLVALGLG